MSISQAVHELFDRAEYPDVRRARHFAKHLVPSLLPAEFDEVSTVTLVDRQTATPAILVLAGRLFVIRLVGINDHHQPRISVESFALDPTHATLSATVDIPNPYPQRDVDWTLTVDGVERLRWATQAWASNVENVTDYEALPRALAARLGWDFPRWEFEEHGDPREVRRAA
jgi:hypothetical protein